MPSGPEPPGIQEDEMKSLIGVALFCSAALAIGSARAQAPDLGGADPAPGAATAYVGQDKQVFYDIEARIDAAMQQAQGSRKAMSQLRALKSEAAYRRARHGGEFRDWDRELLSRRLNQAMASAGINVAQR
jgi:hypothetical protein